mgnify:CR=1 FL=1
MKPRDYQTIIWDWNGTLLNDVDMCVRCMNQLLLPRNIPLLTQEKYRELFTFPVKDYYQRVGIDFEKDPFDIIGHEFMDLYFEALRTCQLQPGVEDVLDYFRQLGLRQFVLSAMEQQSLLQSLKDFGINHYFTACYGIDNHLASGKIERGHLMMKKHEISPELSLMIGDTLHDLEVAKELKMDILLLANGHQNRNRLLKSGEIVMENLAEILTL